MFIYSITNKVNGKQYIGQTVQNVGKRWKSHLKKNSNCKALGNAISLYGKENFLIETVYEATSLEELNQKEQEFINKYNTLAPKGYNLTVGGDRTKHSEESRAKMSAAHKGKPGPMMGKHHSEEAKKAMSDAKKGKTAWNKGLTKSDPRVASYTKYGKNNHAYGKTYHAKPHSEETKRKISNSKLGMGN